MKKVLTFNVGKCVNCKSCAVICSTHNEGYTMPEKARIKPVEVEEGLFSFPMVCQQCENPYCAAVCPVGALTKNDETGVVELEQAKCIGCRFCMVACPFGAMGFVDGKASKCMLCDGDPYCIKACDYDALHYRTIEEIGKERRLEMVAELQKSYGDRREEVEVGLPLPKP